MNVITDAFLRIELPNNQAPSGKLNERIQLRGGPNAQAVNEICTIEHHQEPDDNYFAVELRTQREHI